MPEAFVTKDITIRVSVRADGAHILDGCHKAVKEAVEELIAEKQTPELDGLVEVKVLED